MKQFTRLVILAVLAVFLIAPAACQDFAQGVVYNDANLNRARDPGEKGIAGVRVSNGRTIIQTDASGAYQLPVDDDTVLFVVKPRGWMTPLDENNMPKFYYVHKPNGSPPQKYKGVEPTGPLPQSVDFPLFKREEPDRFKVLFLGDTQPHSKQTTFYMSHDIFEELVGADAVFGVTLGDVVGDNLSLYEDVVAAHGFVGIPWYYVKGNHDSNYDGQPDHDRTYETWTRVFGPPYYSFDYGPVHFVMLNNPFLGQDRGYTGKLDSRQMSWLRSDLALVPKNQLVVLMMHIPIYMMSDRSDVFGILSDHPNTFSISGHTHTLYHHFCGESYGWKRAEAHHHLVNGAACGAWWQGAPDEVGLPHSSGEDGTPNGYSIITFDKMKYSVRWKVARRPADYQMQIYAPDEVASAESGKAKVRANVFMGSDRSKVEMRLEDWPWIPMEVVHQPDPGLLQAKQLEDRIPKPLPWSGLGTPLKNYHIWEALLPDGLPVGAYMIQVRSTDMFGQTDIGRRIIYVR